MHQLAVTGKQAADVAVLIGGQQLEIHRIERDEGMICNLIELERAFWKKVEQGVPPAADGSESSDQALRCLYPKDSGATLDFRKDRQLSAMYTDLVQENIKEYLYLLVIPIFLTFIIALFVNTKEYYWNRLFPSLIISYLITFVF